MEEHTEIFSFPEFIAKGRHGFTSDERAELYPRLPRIILDGTQVLDMKYSDLLLSCEKKFKNDVRAYEIERKLRGISIDPRSKLMRGKLDRPGVEKVYDVISILTFRFRINAEDICLVEPLVYHVAAVVLRIDACFSACSDMIRKANWYITPTLLEHRVKIFSFQDLVEVVMPVTYHCLMAIRALTDEFLNHIFVGLFFSLMRRDHAYRIFDSFLLEGGKILYRYGIALISMFKKLIKAGEYKSGEQFWSEVSIKCNSDTFSFDALHELAFGKSSRFSVLVSKLTSRNYKINRRNIAELKDQIRDPLEKSMILQGDTSGSLKLSADISIIAAASTWFDRSLWSQSMILDTAMSIKLQLYLAEALSLRKSDHLSIQSESNKDITESEVSDPRRGEYPHPQTSRIFSLPGTPIVQSIKLVFSSAKHGRSLSTLYDMVAGRAPCVLLLRSMHKQAVIGVYVSCSIAPSHKTGVFDQRGDSSCFCFRLNSVMLEGSLDTISFFKSAYARKYPGKGAYRGICILYACKYGWVSCMYSTYPHISYLYIFVDTYMFVFIHMHIHLYTCIHIHIFIYT